MSIEAKITEPKMNEHKHIDPEPDRRYIILKPNGKIDSAIVIDATDRYIRLQWEGNGAKKWHPWSWFQPVEGIVIKRIDVLYQGRYCILEQLEMPRPPRGGHEYA